MGQPEFSQIVASAARESVIYQDVSQTSAVAAGANITIDIYAPAGTICEMNMIYIDIAPPVGATTGTHTIYIQTTSAIGSYLVGTSVFGSRLTFDSSDWYSADSLKRPPSNGAPYVSNIKFDNVTGIRLNYVNNTNAIQNTSRTIILDYKKRIVG